jgi:hypothetical protein
VSASSSSPSVLLDAITEAGMPPGSLDAAESISLLRALSAIPDPRDARGRRRDYSRPGPACRSAVTAGGV